MSTSVFTPWNRFRRTAVEPWWCGGSPLVWQASNTGLAHYAMQCKVGKFNLSWWLLGHTQPPQDAEAYRQINHAWVNFVAPTVWVGEQTLVDIAAMRPLRDWQRFVLQSPITYFNGIGLSPKQLHHLVLTGERK